MSTRSQPRMISSAHSQEGSLTMEPPFFSEAAKVTFRSPEMMIFLGMWALRSESMDSQHSFFSAVEIGT